MLRDGKYFLSIKRTAHVTGPVYFRAVMNEPFDKKKGESRQPNENMTFNCVCIVTQWRMHKSQTYVCTYVFF